VTLRSRVLGIGFLLVLSACHPTLPEVPLEAVPAAPLLAPLAARRAAFRGLKALARVEVVRKGRRRVYESVAILQQQFQKFKIEGYGPLGSPMFSLLWDGSDITAWKEGEKEPMRLGPFGLERILGIPISPEDLAAVLSGNIPAVPASETSARCAAAGWCYLELPEREGRWRVKTAPSAGGPRLEGMELFQSDGEKPVLQSAFFYPPGDTGRPSSYPTRVLVSAPRRGVELSVSFVEADWNVQVEDGLFTLISGEGVGL
jgi:hypothetical protein